MELKLADVKPSLYTVIMVTVMAIVGILFLKWLGNKYPGPWTDLLNAV